MLSLCTRLKVNYSSFTSRSSENICSNRGGAKERGKAGWSSVHPWMLMFFVFLNLTLFVIKLRVGYFLSFIDNFIIYRKWPDLIAKSYESVVGVYFEGFFLAMGHLAGLSSKTLWNLPSSSKNQFFYIVIYLIILHSHVKSDKYIFFTFTLFY